jgi:hypothetical protein
MIISDKARKTLFPYQPDSPWKNDRPIYDRLPVVYKDEQVTSNEGLVYIGDPNQKRTGEGSLQVEILNQGNGSKLLVNSGTSAWSEGGIASSAFVVDLESLDIDDGAWMFGLLRVTSTETGLAAVAPAIYPLYSNSWEGQRFVKLATFETKFFTIRSLRDIRLTTDKINFCIADWLTRESDEILSKYQLTSTEMVDEYFNPLTAWKRVDATAPVKISVDITNQGFTNKSGVATPITGIYKPGYSTTLEVKAVSKTGETKDIPYTLQQLEDLFIVAGQFLADNSFVWSWDFDPQSATDFRYLPVGTTLNLEFEVSVLESNDEFWTSGREDALLDYLAEQLGWNGDEAWRGFNMLPEEKRRILLGTFGVHSKDKDYTEWPSPFNESVVPEFIVPLNFLKYSDGTLTILHDDVPMETFSEFALVSGITYDFNKKPIFSGASGGDFTFKEGDNGRWFVTPNAEGTTQEFYLISYDGFALETSTVANPVANFKRESVSCKILKWKDNLNWQTYKDLFKGTWNQKGSYLPFNFVADALRLHGYSQCGVSTPYSQISFAYPRCSTSDPTKAFVEGNELIIDTPTLIDGWVFVWHRIENIATNWDYYRLTARRSITCDELNAKRIIPLSPLTVLQLDELGYNRGVLDVDYTIEESYNEGPYPNIVAAISNLSEGYFFKSDSLINYELDNFHGPFPNVQFDFNSVSFDNGEFGQEVECNLDEGTFAVLRNPEQWISSGIVSPRVGSGVWSQYLQFYPYNYSDWSQSFWSSLHFRFNASMENYLTPLRVWRSPDMHCSDSQTYNYQNPLIADSNIGPGTTERHLYFLRLPPEYKRDSLEWARAEMVANVLGYFGRPRLPTQYIQSENDQYTPSLMDEEVLYPNLTRFSAGNPIDYRAPSPVLPWSGLIYQEDYIESSVVTEEESGSFTQGEVDRQVQSQEFASADTLSYDPRSLIDWDGDYYVRGSSIPLTGNIPVDESNGRLVKVFDGKPIEEFADGVNKRVWDNRPDLGIVRKVRKEEQFGSNYRVAYAYFAADMAVAGDPVFDPNYRAETLGYLI